MKRLFCWLCAMMALVVFIPRTSLAEGAELVETNHYCDNRGSAGGTGDYSKKFASGDIRACVQFVKNNPKCSPYFSLGSDGYCDCAPVGKSCGAKSFNAYNTYKLVSGTDCWNTRGNAYVDLKNAFCGGGNCTTTEQSQQLEGWYLTSIANGEGSEGNGRKEGASCLFRTPQNCWNAMGNAYVDLRNTYCGGGFCTTEAQALKLEEWYPTSIANGEGGVHQGRKEGAYCQYIRSHTCWNAMGNRYKDLQNTFCDGGICETEKHGNALEEWYPSSIMNGEGSEGNGRKEGERRWNRRVFGGEGGTYFSPRPIQTVSMRYTHATKNVWKKTVNEYYLGMTTLKLNGVTAGFGCESTWTWLYGTAMIFLYGDYADSYESAICGFWVGGITLNLGVN